MSLSLSAAFAMQLGNEPLEICEMSEAIVTVMTESLHYCSTMLETEMRAPDCTE
jgi:hypothetical protein